jgi:hypothetical protein
MVPTLAAEHRLFQVQVQERGLTPKRRPYRRISFLGPLTRVR